MKPPDRKERAPLDAPQFEFDYSTLPVFASIKAHLERTTHWVYDGNGRWSTSNRMVRLRGNGSDFYFEVWLISGDVKRIHVFDVHEPDDLITRLLRIGI
ncbi:MAG TPA: hypothetical protein VEY71_07565 [Chitinophagales bacterium]|nr:hypothetical protein [Chitinophagales bacterium]